MNTLRGMLILRMKEKKKEMTTILLCRMLWTAFFDNIIVIYQKID